MLLSPTIIHFQLIDVQEGSKKLEILLGCDQIEQNNLFCQKLKFFRAYFISDALQYNFSFALFAIRAAGFSTNHDDRLEESGKT